jgi:hypothetical protein
MIIKNKTNAHQSVVLEDGSKITARPFRTISIKSEPKGLNKDVWEIESPNIETKKGK